MSSYSDACYKLMLKNIGFEKPAGFDIDRVVLPLSNSFAKNDFNFFVDNLKTAFLKKKKL